MSLWMKPGKTQVGDRAEATIRHHPLLRRLAGLTAALIAMPVLTLGLTSGSVSASGAGQVTIYRGIYYPKRITAGPDGALWFTKARLDRADQHRPGR